MYNRFLFRGKQTNDDKWIYGYLSFVYVDGKNQNGFIYTDKGRIYCQDEARAYDVWRKTIGQCTGLQDKNNKLIFEGDIFKWHENIYTVVFTDACFFAMCKYDYKNSPLSAFIEVLKLRDIEQGIEMYSVMTNEAEIIGNIYDNPELLNN